MSRWRFSKSSFLGWYFVLSAAPAAEPSLVAMMACWIAMIAILFGRAIFPAMGAAPVGAGAGAVAWPAGAVWACAIAAKPKTSAAVAKLFVKLKLLNAEIPL